MSRFMVLYRASVGAADQMAAAAPDSGAALMQAWMEWGFRAGEAVVDIGWPAMTVADPGDSSSLIGGYSVFQAESLDEMRALLADHPHRAWGTIEVLELLQLPGM